MAGFTVPPHDAECIQILNEMVSNLVDVSASDIYRELTPVNTNGVEGVSKLTAEMPICLRINRRLTIASESRAHGSTRFFVRFLSRGHPCTGQPTRRPLPVLFGVRWPYVRAICLIYKHTLTVLGARAHQQPIWLLELTASRRR